ncbi:MAG TPA: hypothetical protein VGB85_14730 [Nannocystis sp.]
MLRLLEVVCVVLLVLSSEQTFEEIHYAHALPLIGTRQTLLHPGSGVGPMGERIFTGAGRRSQAAAIAVSSRSRDRDLPC